MPSTDASWKQLQENLKAARALAAFLDLESDSSQVDEFRRKHPDFMSPLWWKIGRQWQFKQAQFRKVWDEGFPQLGVLHLVSDASVFEGSKVITRAVTESGSVLEKVTSGEEYAHSFAYKKALLFLFTESWRAKTCRYEQCQRHSIAEKPGNRFHSPECAAKYRKTYKRENWTEHKDKLNKRRRNEYALHRRSQSAKRHSLQKGR